MDDNLQAWRTAQLVAAPNAKIVLGETATTGDAGCPGLSNSFAAGFYWVDQLGRVAENGYWQVYRQDLVGFSGMNEGSSYALAGDPGWVDGPLTPNPDFFTSLLWKRLMGNRHLAVSLSVTRTAEVGTADDGGVRAFVTCARRQQQGGGGVALAFLNPSVAAVTLDLQLSDSGIANGRADAEVEPLQREMYVLTTGAGDYETLSSRSMRLNGAAAVLTADSELLPKLADGQQPMVLPPYSYGFVVLPTAAATACL